MANSSSVAVKLACMLVMCMVVCAPLAEGSITCGQVVGSVSPCISYLRTGGRIPPACCNGIRSLNNAAKTTPDRQAACRCLISSAKSIPGLKPNLISGLPSACGVNLPYTISPTTNCNNIK